MVAFVNILYVLLGFFTPLIPFFGNNLLIYLSTTLIIAEFISQKKYSNRRTVFLRNKLIICTIPFLIIILCWSIAKFIAEVDFSSLVALYKYNQQAQRGISNYLLTIFKYPFAGITGFWIVFRYLIFVFLIIIFCQSEQGKARYKKGFFCGLAIALIITFLQIFSFIPFEKFSNFSTFWQWQLRFPGTFSDPNAFGIFSVMALPLILVEIIRSKSYSKNLYCILFFTLFSLTWYSGSRSYILGLFLEGILICFFMRKDLKESFSKVKKTYLFIAIIPFLILTAFFLSNTSTGARILETFTLTSFSKAMFSRVLFWKLGFWIWFDNPIVGVGVNSFRDLVTPYLLDHGMDLNLWSDNSNNFYLGILAELGVVGLVVFLFSIINIVKINNNFLKEDEITIATDRQAKLSLIIIKAGVISFAVLLLLGPHLDFSEVLVLVAFLVAHLISPSICKNAGMPSSTGKFLIIVAVYLALLVYKSIYLQPHGFYAWEKDEKGVFRWSRPTSYLIFNCLQHPVNSAGVAEISIRSPRTQNIYLKTAFDGERIFHFSSNKTQNLPITCNKVEIPVWIKTEKIFVPDLMKAGRDKRILGVQVWK